MAFPGSEDRRFCANCREYVPYLWSPQASYCVRCGSPAQLFSGEDLSAFRRASGIPLRGFGRVRGATRAVERGQSELERLG